MKVILGANGQLGKALQEVFPDARAYNHKELDITNQDHLERLFMENNIELVLNAAAYTNVNNAQKDPTCYNTNMVAPTLLGQMLNGATMVHYSTEMVFDGTAEFYDETAKTNPLNEYGKSKALGEEGLRHATGPVYIIRTGWLFGPGGNTNFVKKIKAQPSPVRVTPDEFGSPTYTKDLAAMTKLIIDERDKYAPGIYHVTNSGVCSRYDFARAIRDDVVRSLPLPGGAPRPRQVVLKNTKLPKLRSWRSALREYLGGEL